MDTKWIANGYQMDTNGSKWIQMDPNGSFNWIQLDPIAFKWLNKLIGHTPLFQILPDLLQNVHPAKIWNGRKGCSGHTKIPEVRMDCQTPKIWNAISADFDPPPLERNSNI